MARNFVAASSQYMEAASSPLTGVNVITLACWFRPTTVVSNSLFGIVNTATDDYFVIGNTAPGAVYIEVNGSSGQAATGPTLTASSWHHVCGVQASATSRTAYLNGTAGTTNTTSNGTAPAGLNSTIVGANRISGTRLAFANGDIADTAIWNVALTASEILALSRGANPRRIRPTALVFYAPLWGTSSPERDYTTGGRHLTLAAAAPTVSNAHARTGPLFGGSTAWPPTAVAGGTDATVTTPAGTATGTSPIPAVTAGSTVTTPAATGLGSSPIPDVSGGTNSTVTTPAATGLGSSPAPTVSAGATVTSVVADATGASPVPVVSGGVNATVTAVPAAAVGYTTSNLPLSSSVETGPATALGTSPIPAASGSGSATTVTPPADATGTSPVQTVTAGSTVTTPAAAGLGSSPIPAVTAGATVTAPTALALGTAPAPTASGTSAGEVAATPATATGQAPAPTLTASATVTSPAATGLGDAPPPTVTAFAGADTHPPAATATGAAPAPTLTATAQLITPPATATGQAPAAIAATRNRRWELDDPVEHWDPTPTQRWAGIA